MGKNIIFQYPIPEDTSESKNVESFYDLEMSSLATMLCPSKQQLVNKPLRLTIDNISFVARPTALPISEKYDLTHFSFVFGFPKPVDEERSNSFLNILKVYSKVLLREQNRCNFLTNEIYSLIELRDKHKSDWTTILSHAFKQSELAKELKSITDSIINGDSIQIRVNGWIEMCIRYPYDNISQNKNSVKPYDACVILKDSPRLNYPVDGVDIVEQIRSLLSPHKTLQEISKKENLSLNTVCSIVQHMIEWGVVKTVPKVTMKSVLHVCPCVELPLDEKHVLEFKTTFNLLPSLIETLGYFHKSKILADHFEGNKKEEWRSQFFKAICWLLRNNYVFQSETYIQLGKKNKLTFSTSCYYIDRLKVS